jgi:hypothetical protein
MRVFGFRSISALALLLAIVAPYTSAQLAANAQKKLDPADPALPQAWIALGRKLDVDKVKPGDVVAGMTINFFAFRTCVVMRGVVLHGKVVAVKPWDEATHQASIDLQFSATCQDGTELPFTLIAAYDPIPNGGRQIDIIESLPVNINPNFSSHMDPKYPNRPPSDEESFPIPSARPGEVHRIAHLSVLVAKGEQGSTQLASDQKRFHIEEGTRLGLVPAAIPTKPGR